MAYELIQSIDGIYFEWRNSPDCYEHDLREGQECWFDWEYLPEGLRPLEHQSYKYRGFGWCDEIDGEF